MGQLSSGWATQLELNAVFCLLMFLIMVQSIGKTGTSFFFDLVNYLKWAKDEPQLFFVFFQN